MSSELREAIRRGLGPDDHEFVVCTRAWSAWELGTMTDEDFVDACEVEGVVDALEEAIFPVLEAAKRRSRLGGLGVVAAAGESDSYFVAVVETGRQWFDGPFKADEVFRRVEEYRNVKGRNAVAVGVRS